MLKEDMWTIDEDASTELEVRELLAALVRTLKPTLVVETGCYLGRATKAMGLALSKNGMGSLVSCDTDPEMVARAFHTCEELPVEVRLCRGIDLPELREADLVFLDSDYAWRRAEFVLVKPGAIVIIHDTRISYDAAVPPHEGWVREQGGIMFDTYRGLGIMRKATGP